MTGTRSTRGIDDIEVVFDLPVPDLRLGNDDSLATVLLVSRLPALGGRPLKASEYWSLLGCIEARPAPGADRGAGEDRAARAPDAGGSPGVVRAADGSGMPPGAGPSVLVGLSEEELVREVGLSERLAARIVDLSARAVAVAFELERLEQSGIRTVTAFDERYPQRWRARLGSKAPPLLHAAGALELLDAPGLGVVGSRDVSPEGGEVALEVARLAARRGLPLVSGGARGVDQIAMDAAFEAGGGVVGILAESLSRKLKRPEVRRAVYDGATVICTPYSPDAPFSAGNAMGRNKLIYAQAELTVVVASDDGTGGTWSGAIEALKHGYGRVSVWRGDGEGPGNEPLQQRGAEPVSSLEDIEALLDRGPAPAPEPRPAPADPTGQQSLFAAALLPGACASR